VQFEKLRRLKPEHRQQLFGLWNSEFPVTFLHKHADDFENYLFKLDNPHHYLVSLSDKTIIAWAYRFERYNETWFGLLVHPNYQRKGHGSRLLDILKQENEELNGWVIDHRADMKQNGERYFSPLEFYLKNKFSPIPDVRLELDLLSAVKMHWEK
jgi:GNAT superfamily N-acetyltransferase